MANDVENTDTLPLEYGPPARLARLKRWWRWIMLLGVCIAVAVPVYRYRESLSRRAAWLYWSHQCAVHQMPAGVELVVTDPKRVQQLLATESDYVLRPDQTFNGVPPKPVAIYVPRAWRKLAEIDGRCEWIDGSWTGLGPIPFLGSLRRPDGVYRLVAM